MRDGRHFRRAGAAPWPVAAAVAATLVLTGLLAMSLYQRKSSPSSKRLLRVSVLPPPGAVLNVNGSSPPLSHSLPMAAGWCLAQGMPPESTCCGPARLMLTPPSPSRVPRGPRPLSASPDGRFIAFFSNGN